VLTKSDNYNKDNMRNLGVGRYIGILLLHYGMFESGRAVVGADFHKRIIPGRVVSKFTIQKLKGFGELPTRVSGLESTSIIVAEPNTAGKNLTAWWTNG